MGYRGLLGELKGLGIPWLRFLRSWLDIDVVVNRDRWQVVIVAKDAMDYGISLFSAINFNFTAISLECFAGELDTFPDIVSMIRIDGDRRSFNKTLQQRLKLLAMRVGKREKTIPFQGRGHSRSSVELSCESLRAIIMQIGPISLIGPVKVGRPNANSQHLHAYGDFSTKLRPAPCVHSKGLVLRVILASPCFRPKPALTV